MPTNNLGNQGQGHPGSQNPERKQGNDPNERREKQQAGEADKERTIINQPDYHRDQDIRRAGAREPNRPNPDANPRNEADSQSANLTSDTARSGERSASGKNSTTENPQRSPDRDF